MKKIVYILIITIVLVGCSKDKSTTPTDNSNTYQATVKENFTDPFKRIENIQVEDFIPYTIVIEDSGDDENVEYRLTSVRESQDYHQTIGKDFGLYLKKDDNAPYDLEKKYISFSKKGNYDFYIRPFVPGTFKLNFELRKFINNKPIGRAVKINITFNAVRFSLLMEMNSMIPSPILEGVNVTKRFYYFIYIDAGSEKNDKYIEGGDRYFFINGQHKVTYLVNDNEKTREGHFGLYPCIFIEEFDEDPPKIRVKNIKIIQSIGEEDTYIIEYHNLNIRNY